ncbi:hypothetical protein [Mycoplasma sp. Mirounga ES2805-ORL]|uniref:hypothetical protein n=1 Tax=Mycoplasma sp. Mirounga ES2805-ORL TaxID=754514 RepID=UPI00197B4F06|nr:hypothetical protein [Mycoplasma sp. Mirounga ES2805-ORL]QSF13864.1 hypothetical protein JXZ90_01005 [Mycoplasma sp. Mirounga ES2805-ORL]
MCIYHAVDAGTGMLLALWVEKEETNIGYQKLFEELFKNYGLLQVVYSDCRTTMHNGKDYETPFAIALYKKNIELVSSTNPKHKPNVERSFDIAQKNYPLHFHLNKINSIEKLQNEKQKVIDEYNKKFKKVLSNKQNVFRKPNKAHLEDKMILKIKRKVLNGVVKYDNKYLAPFDENNNRVYMDDNSTIWLGMNSPGNVCFITNNKIYKALEPKGHQLSKNEILMIKLGTDPTIVYSRQISKFYNMNRKFTESNIEKIKKIIHDRSNEEDNSLVINMLKEIIIDLKENLIEIKKANPKN